MQRAVLGPAARSRAAWTTLCPAGRPRIHVQKPLSRRYLLQGVIRSVKVDSPPDKNPEIKWNITEGFDKTIETSRISKHIPKDDLPDEGSNEDTTKQRPSKETSLPIIDPVAEQNQLSNILTDYIANYKTPANLADIDVDKWYAELPFPPDVFWEKWSSRPELSSLGSDLKARRLLNGWQDALQYQQRRATSQISTDNQIVQFHAVWSLPLLGPRAVTGYGYSLSAARQNSLAALASSLYQSDELETILTATIASQNLITIFEESCKHGSFPRYSVTTTPVKTKPGDTNGPEQHTFRVRLGMPGWNIHRTARSRSFPEALAQVTTYIRRRLDRLGKHWTLPDGSNSMFKNLDFDAALIFLRFATQKLKMKGFYLTPLKLDVPGPQHIHKVQQRSLGIAPHQPMLRKRDARKIAVMTAAIRFIHNFGPDSLDGFEEVLQDIKAEKAASKAEAEKDGIE